jgi:hypothetical protein
MTNVNADLQARVAALPWHHSIDLGGGVVTAGNKSSLIFDRVDLSGRTVRAALSYRGVKARKLASKKKDA